MSLALQAHAARAPAPIATREGRRRCRPRHRALALLACLLLSGCAAAEQPPLSLEDRAYGQTILTSHGTELGIASWYGPGFHGKQTATGERYDQHGMTAAHRTLPLGTRVEVRDMRTNQRVVVRINDRGPYKAGRSIDLSYAAAKQLGIVERGTTPVEIRLLDAKYEQWPRIVYCIQLGAFGRREIADRLGLAAADHGYRSYLKLVGDDPLLYGVRVGPYESRGEAKRVLRALSRDGFEVALVEEDPVTAGYLMRAKNRAGEKTR
jgi:rare lipoprotein A